MEDIKEVYFGNRFVGTHMSLSQRYILCTVSQETGQFNLERFKLVYYLALTQNYSERVKPP